ncbi:hypothetical protein EGW08_019225 [Elysia chlorotica]|uniref:Armadillo repeat-containing domain-containing protein n=1 Tax=Elysia chlorotica TaxID=188477 RepID=A0A3S0Z8B0_ELYCH|nr:hypothetical protein EGW08_019225 [Elysia chlorotica]
MSRSSDVDLAVWVQTAECPLNSDSSSGDSPNGGFGDLTINAGSNGDGSGDGYVEGAAEDFGTAGGVGGARGMDSMESYMGGGGRVVDCGAGDCGRGDAVISPDVDKELLRRLAARHDDFLSTLKSRYRFSSITELDEWEQCAEADIIRETTHCPCWPCDLVTDFWVKVKIYVAKRCKLACCQEYTWPHEWARRRRFCISKAYYMRILDMTTREQDSILRWADLVASQDANKFRTQRVAWSIMEEHLAILAYSQNKELVFLAARICIEALAKNKAPYITLISNMGGLNVLLKLTATDFPLLKTRVFACLEIMSKNASVSERLVQQGILALAVHGLDANSSPDLQLSCLFILNSLCQERRNLTKALAVDNYAVAKSCMRILTDWTLHIPGKSQTSRTQSLNLHHVQSWCTIPRQSLVLLCKLCVDETACRQLVKRGLVLKLRSIWFKWDMDRELVMEALAVIARWPRLGDKICKEGFLPIMSEALQAKDYIEQVLEIMLNLGRRHLSEMIEAGLLDHVVSCFGQREFCRHDSALLSILASFISSERVRRLLLADDGRPYTVLLEVAMSTTDYARLQTCSSVLSKMDTQVVPQPLLRSHCVLLVAYVDKLLKTGPDGLVLHGLWQLRDYLRVDFLAKAFHDHHCQRVVEILAAAPYKDAVRSLAQEVLQILTDQRSRQASMKVKSPRSNNGTDTWQCIDTDSDDEPSPPGGAVLQHSQHTPGMPGDTDFMAVAEKIVTSAVTDAASINLEACAASGFSDSDLGDQNDATLDAAPMLQTCETEEDSDKFSDVDPDAEVQVNIIDATDEDSASLEDTEDNGISRNEESDDDFEIITVNDQDYVNI